MAAPSLIQIISVGACHLCFLEKMILEKRWCCPICYPTNDPIMDPYDFERATVLPSIVPNERPIVQPLLRLPIILNERWCCPLCYPMNSPMTDPFFDPLIFEDAMVLPSIIRPNDQPRKIPPSGEKVDVLVPIRTMGWSMGKGNSTFSTLLTTPRSTHR
jgi:hypothetical protein